MLEILFDFISLISLLIIIGNLYYQQRINMKLRETVKRYDEIIRDCFDLLKMKRS